MRISEANTNTAVCSARNFDPLTETYGLSFYTQYLAKWPEYFQLAESPSGQIMGYSKYCISLCARVPLSSVLYIL